jgi:cell division protein FtsB
MARRAGRAGKGTKKRTPRKGTLPQFGAVWVAPTLVLIAAAVTLLLDRETGVLPLLELRGEASRIEARVDALEDDRERLRARVIALRTDPLEVEALAREQLGMVRPDEVVLRLGAD